MKIKSHIISRCLSGGTLSHRIVFDGDTILVMHFANTEPHDLDFHIMNEHKKVKYNLTTMSEEELFQLSMVWEHKFDIFLLKAIQETYKHGIIDKPRTFNDDDWTHDWEY